MMTTPLDVAAVYISPTGRRCKWVPLLGPSGHWSGRSYFAYVSATGALRDGFALTPQNYGILRREASDAPAR